jgi:Immunity protein 26
VKRPYGEGDWFAVPLGDGRFATGIVTHGTRKAIVGSFFGPAREAIPRLEELVAFQAADALWSGRFSDRAIVQHRWPSIGAQPGFVRNAWDVPPPAPAASPGSMECRLRALVDGAAFEPGRLSVRDVRSPIEAHAFDNVPERVCVQWREPLSAQDLVTIAGVVASNSGASVRLCGNAVSQLQAIAAWPLRRLQLDGESLPDELARLPSVRDLELDGVPRDLTSTLAAFPRLQTLKIRARGAAVNAASLANVVELETLVLRDATLTGAASLHERRALRVVDIESATVDRADALLKLALRELRLAGVAPIRTIAALHEHPTLQTLALAGLIDVNDLGPIATIPHLESLDLRGFWQCDVEDVAFIARMPSLRRLHLDIGGRRKNIEIYRRRSLAEPLPILR